KGYCYVIKNVSGEAIDNWVPLKTDAASVALLNPMTKQTCYAATRSVEGKTEVDLQLSPGETCIMETSNTVATDGIPYSDVKKIEARLPLEGESKISFTEGGPVLPSENNTHRLVSRNEFEGM